MATVAVDSNVIVGARLRRDQWHRPGTEIVRGVDAGDLPAGHLNHFGLAEVLTTIEKRGGDQPAIDTLDFLTESRGFELVHVSTEDINRGLAIYRREDDIEAVDCFTVAYMQRVGLDYIYSFDDDFDRFEAITRLDTAADPYA